MKFAFDIKNDYKEKFVFWIDGKEDKAVIAESFEQAAEILCIYDEVEAFQSLKTCAFGGEMRIHGVSIKD